MKHKELKRVLAMAGVIVLGGLYVATLILALMKSDLAQTLFRGSLACTFIVPVFLYLIKMVADVLRPKKSAVIDAVVFDVGNVLADFPWNEFVGDEDISEEAKAVILEKVVPSKLWYEFDVNLRPFAEIVDEFVKLDPRYEKEIRAVVEKEHTIITPFWYTGDLIRGLKMRGYKVYYLSNWTKEWYDDLKDTTLSYLKDTDGGIFSFDVHVAKPDPKIYQMLIEKYKLKPERTIFIDDTKANVTAAQKAGMAGIHFTGYNDMIEKLSAVGVDI